MKWLTFPKNILRNVLIRGQKEGDIYPHLEYHRVFNSSITGQMQFDEKNSKIWISLRNRVVQRKNKFFFSFQVGSEYVASS